MYLSFLKNKIILFLFLFLYIYNIVFIFFPGSLNSRSFIGVLGFIYMLLVTRKIDKSFFNTILLYFFLIICTSIIIILNISKNADYWLLQHLIISLIYLIGAYFLCVSFTKKVSFSSFIYIIVLAILFHNLIAFIAMISHGFLQDMIFSIQKLDSEIFFELKDGYTRAIGFGVGNFFMGGVTSGLGIIFSFFLYKIKRISIFKLVSFVSLIFITGIFIARTTMIGLIGVLLLFEDFKKDLHKIIKVFSVFILSAILLFMYIINFLKDIINLNWAFELFFAYQEGNIETGSTNELKEMYVFPNNLSTWILGDGRMMADDGVRYYMGTDVGFLRLLFFGGIFFTIVFFICQFILSYIIIKRDKDLKYLIILINLYSLLLNFKGFTNLNYILFLILAFLVNKKRNNVIS